MALLNTAKRILKRINLIPLIYVTSLLGAAQINATEYEHHVDAFGSSIAQVMQNLAGKCDKLKSRTIQKSLSVANNTQRQLECTGYEYFGKKRFVEIMFSDDQLDIIHVMNMRDMLPDFKHMLEMEFGEPTVSTSTVDYFADAGISLRVFPDEVSFVSERAKQSYSEYMDEIKDNKLNMSLSKEQWLHDIAILDIYIRNNHINPFWHQSEAGYMALFYQARDYSTKME